MVAQGKYRGKFMPANSASFSGIVCGGVLAGLLMVYVPYVHGQSYSPSGGAPPFRIASKVSIQNPVKLIDLVVSIPPARLTDDDLLALVKLLKARYCSYDKILIAIFTNYRAARVFNPDLEDPWFAEY